MAHLAAENASQPSASMQTSLESFPSENGPSGRTVWAVGVQDESTNSVSINFTEAAQQAGRLLATNPGELPPSGWAFGDFTLNASAAILIRCDTYFMLDDDAILWTPDAYNDGRSVNVFHLEAGKHRIFVKFVTGTFTCDMFKDSSAARENITAFGGQATPACPVVLLSDMLVPDIVEGKFVSPYLAVPVLNVATDSISLHSAQLVPPISGLSVDLDSRLNGAISRTPIAAGQAFILPLILRQSNTLECQNDVLNISIKLTPMDSQNALLPSVRADLVADCRSTRVGGYRVTFPDYDMSIQHMWVAPPNTARTTQGRCPKSGCPVMLSLHGADVVIGPIWGHTYSFGNKTDGWTFPYPAWLVQPSNRHRYGTDWQAQGYDNAVVALDYVAKHTPGLWNSDEQAALRPDLDRLLVTGHSMGGHGCMVFSTHEPDRLLASACVAGWTSQRRYVRINVGLRGYVENGMAQSRMSEHDADFLSRNLLGVPFKLVYGADDDNVPPTEPQYMQALVDSYSGNKNTVQISELPRTGHWMGQNVPELASFFEEHLKEPNDNGYLLPSLPQMFEFVVAGPSSFGTKGNLKVLQVVDASRPAHFYVRRCPYGIPSLNGTSCEEVLNASFLEEATKADAVWIIKTYNVRRFQFLVPGVRGRPLPRAIVLDGGFFDDASFGQSSNDSHRHFCQARPPSDQTLPIWGVCKEDLWESVQRGGPGPTANGPLGNVLRRAPVCIVHGNATGQKTAAVFLANKLYFVSRYAVPTIDASRTSQDNFPEQCSSANLIFIGHAVDNAEVEANRCAFPYLRLHQESNGFSLGGFSYTGPSVGLLALGRLKDGRLALLLHGTDASSLAHAVARVPVSSFVDSQDFMVLGPNAGWEGLSGVLAAGFLDNQWRLSSSSSWAEPEHSSRSWQGKAFDPSSDDQCLQEKQDLMLSDAEILSFVPSSSPYIAVGHWLLAVSMIIFISS
jgi:pimeloyl-ACP methyl ester carboxylesterase